MEPYLSLFRVDTTTGFLKNTDGVSAPVDQFLSEGKVRCTRRMYDRKKVILGGGHRVVVFLFWSILYDFWGFPEGGGLVFEEFLSLGVRVVLYFRGGKAVYVLAG